MTRVYQAQETSTIRVFVLLLTTYYYDVATAAFVPLAAIPPELSMQVQQAKAALQAVAAGEPCIYTAPLHSVGSLSITVASQFVPGAGPCARPDLLYQSVLICV